ncbi:hypothetical protein C8J36_104144 [Rhizobium sp. PP-F2F-G48]|uniref:hypothetical protein n=1 Tax=Rhizobium sp. PP-F2F-G48 TaxID=2135651 RepID=UPI0010540653|nr:hypothetical protein [Rhizobium sp. PP-F2F-G48]TCM54952.1 hypothetical protein C8J36_104144 [Rhizobium sp. PP-F2F-G48]
MIRAPISEIQGPDRQLECHRALDAHVMEAVDQATKVGWTASEVFGALEAVIADRRLAYSTSTSTTEANSEISMASGVDGATANL